MLSLRKVKRVHLLLVVLMLCVIAIPFRSRARASFVALIQILRGKKTVSQRVRQYENDVNARLAPLFARTGITYPPRKIALLAFKDENLLELWVSDEEGIFKRLKRYPILAASGSLGPKLRNGDAQVPEGVYHVESLNPNSMYHLALRLDYPNDFDRERAKLDGRNNIGSDIMIHGKQCSIGCLAMGDPASEELFVLAALAGIENVTVIISPVDFRVRELPATMARLPDWTPALYERIKGAMANLQEKPVERL